MLPARRTVLGGLSFLPVFGCSGPAPTRRKTTGAEPEIMAGKGGLVELIIADPELQLDLRYATTNNFTGRVLYSAARAFLIKPAAQALLRANQSAMEFGFGLSIFDAYRPWRVTKQLWDATPPGPKRNYVANPQKGSRHNRGCAVDLTLYGLIDGKQVEMPSQFDDFSEKAHRSYADDSAAARRHAEILERVMMAEGFIGMSNEWWHFDFNGWEDFPILDVPYEGL
jgi:zinc D-Ala-D-Ala dipeptidase